MLSRCDQNRDLRPYNNMALYYTGVSNRQFSSLSILTFHNVYITRDHKNVRKCIGMCVKLGCRYHSIT